MSLGLIIFPLTGDGSRVITGWFLLPPQSDVLPWRPHDTPTFSWALSTLAKLDNYFGIPGASKERTKRQTAN